MSASAFKLEQQLHAAMKDRDAWKAKAENYHAKLQKPALIGQPQKLREEIAFWKAQAQSYSSRIEVLEARCGKLLEDRDEYIGQVNDLKVKLKELVGELNLARALPPAAEVGESETPLLDSVSLDDVEGESRPCARKSGA